MHDLMRKSVQISYFSPMENNAFLEVMETNSDSKLLEIVEKKRGDYQPAALLAAEYVLRKRNIKWIAPEADEVIEMTIEEIDNEVEARLKKGEHISDIRADFKSKGVDIDDLDGEKSRANSFASNFIMIRLIGLGIGAFLAIIAALKETGDQESLKFLFITLTIVVVILFLVFTLRKKK